MRSDQFVSVAIILDQNTSELVLSIEQVSSYLSRTYAYHEIVVIDNSTDSAIAAAGSEILTKVENVRIVKLGRQVAKEHAIVAALETSIGDFLVLMNPLTDPVEKVEELLATVSGGKDVVIATIASKKHRGFVERIVADRFDRLTKKALGFQVPHGATQFMVLSRYAVNSITRIRSKSRYLLYFIALIGLKQASVSFQPLGNLVNDDSRGSLLRQLRINLAAIFTYSALPLRLASQAGFLAALFSLVAAFYVLFIALFRKNPVQGWVTTNLFASGMFFCLFLLLGVLSEYVYRIIVETRDLPMYFVESEGHSVISGTDEGKLNVVER